MYNFCSHILKYNTPEKSLLLRKYVTKCSTTLYRKYPDNNILEILNKDFGGVKNWYIL